jgi:zinc protease
VTAPRVLPPPGPPAVVSFPAIARTRLATGLSVWSIHLPGTSIVSCQLVLPAGAADDPPDRFGLASVTADMLDEGAAGHDAVAIAKMLAQLGTALEVEVSADVTTIGFTALARSVGPALRIVADLVARPHLAEADLRRVRELRQSRLRQMRVTASAAADRALIEAVFGAQPYGHGVLGTTRALEATSVDDVRAFHAARFGPETATLILGGDIEHASAVASAEAALADWKTGALVVPRRAAASSPDVAPPSGPPPIVLVDKPGAPQSALRVGHLAPPRATPAYHTLLALNALLGGQFSSRLNANLREARGITYGVRSGFEFRRMAGSFACDTSVQADATAIAIAEMLRECAGVAVAGSVGDDELARAKAALTRGYARHFETADQLVRAATQLLTFDLDEGTFDRFVPAVEAVDPAAVERAAREFLWPDRSAVVVVGDADQCRPQLDTLDRVVIVGAPEF